MGGVREGPLGCPCGSLGVPFLFSDGSQRPGGGAGGGLAPIASGDRDGGRAGLMAHGLQGQREDGGQSRRWAIGYHSQWRFCLSSRHHHFPSTCLSSLIPGLWGFWWGWGWGGAGGGWDDLEKLRTLHGIHGSAHGQINDAQALKDACGHWVHLRSSQRIKARRGRQGGAGSTQGRPSRFPPTTHTAYPGTVAWKPCLLPAGSRAGEGKATPKAVWYLLLRASEPRQGQSHLHHQHHLSISILHAQSGTWWSPLVLNRSDCLGLGWHKGWEGRRSHVVGVCPLPGTLCCHSTCSLSS